MKSKNWETAVEDFIMENEIVKVKDYFKAIPLPLILPLAMIALVVCIFTIYASDMRKTIALILVSFTVIISLIAALIIIVFAFADNRITAKLVEKKKYTYDIETCIKVLKKGNQYQAETDKQNLYSLSNSVSIGEKLLVLKVGNRDTNIYSIKQVSAELKELMAQ